MKTKPIMLAITIAILILIAYNPYSARHAAAINAVPPDSIRIPSSLTVLADTPYYANPNLEEPPLGTYPAASVLTVMGVESSWAQTQVWWKIETPYGPVWTRPDPWNVDVPPPPRLMLFENVPLFPSQDDTQPPTATLSAQEVQVISAGKQWFYTNDPKELHWILIHTEAYGDQWVHLPVGQIGYILPVDYYAYYSYQTLLPDPNYSGPIASRAGPKFPTLFNETAHVTGEYVTVYNRSYQVESDKGKGYIKEAGPRITKGTESVTLLGDTPLFPTPGQQMPWMMVLQPQTLEAFEKFENSTIYHVHTELWDGWVDTSDSEPVSLEPLDYSLELKGPHQLYRFPKQAFHIPGATLDHRIVKPAGTWKDAQGNVWYLLDTKVGKAWLVMNAYDRLVPNDGTPNAELTFRETTLDTVTVQGTDLQVSRSVIGFLKNDQIYLSLSYLVNRFGFHQEGQGESGSSLRFHANGSNGYVFQIDAQNQSATTFWNEQVEEHITLQESPVQTETGVYVNGEDAKLLLGLSIDWFPARQNFYLFRDEYEVNWPNMQSASPSSGEMPLWVTRYERPLGPNFAKPGFLPVINVAKATGQQAELKSTGPIRSILQAYQVNVSQQGFAINQAAADEVKQWNVTVKQGAYILHKQPLISPTS